jgi:hypothetical protein
MADKKITQLPSASIATGSNVLPIVQGGVTDQITVTNLGTGILNLGLAVTASTVSSTSNGNGTNFKVGDDVWIGDVNLSNTMQIKGQQAESKAFIKFGSGSNSPIVGGTSGSGLFQITGSVDVSGSVTAKEFVQTSNVQGTGSLLLTPDSNDSRYLEIYNTSATDTHITASGGLIFLGDDTTYVRVDNYSNFNSIEIKADSEIKLLGDTIVTGSVSITGSGFINNNSILTSADTGSFLTNDSSGSNVDTLGGGAVRTLYSRNSDVTYTSGSGINVDFLSGSVSWGSRNLPQSFFDESLNFTAKILHFRTVGKFASGGTSDTNAAVRLQIGNQIISGSDLGTQTLDFSSNKPFEILGEIIITAGSASACYSIGWCDQTGDMRRTPLSDVTVSSNFADLTPGNFEIIISGSTNRTMTTYYSYFQVYN